MISYEIQRPRKPVALPTIDEHRLANQHRLAEGEPVEPRPVWVPRARTAIGMGKHQYAEWMNENVYPCFMIGDLVTLHTMPFVPGEPPRMYWVVSDFQEVHYLVDIDTSTKQPKAVGLRTAKYNIPVWYPPRILRHLFPAEKQAINDKLRNQAETSQDISRTSSGDPERRGEVVEEKIEKKG